MVEWRRHDLILVRELFLDIDWMMGEIAFSIMLFILTIPVMFGSVMTSPTTIGWFHIPMHYVKNIRSAIKRFILVKQCLSISLGLEPQRIFQPTIHAVPRSLFRQCQMSIKIQIQWCLIENFIYKISQGLPDGNIQPSQAGM